MPRKLRVEYEGAIYHVMNRGDRREPVFLEEADYELFDRTLGEACGKTGWQVHAYCLMPNHFHLVMETPAANLVAGMRWLLGTYTARFNRRHRLFGHLFSGRYKSLIVDGSSTGYLKTVCDYVHLNPARARLLKPGQRLAAWRWSSWPQYLAGAGKRRPWLRVDRVLGESGIVKDNAAGRRGLEKAMEGRKEQESAGGGSDWKELRRSWCWGEEAFREELLERIAERQGPAYHGLELREADEQKAQRLVREMMAKAGWGEERLGQRGKGDRSKARMAARLRRETTMTWAWIAGRLGMGHWRTAANAVRKQEKQE